MKFAKLKWFIARAYENRHKYKLKAFLRLFYDAKYRHDIRYRTNLLAHHRFKRISVEIPLGELVPSHGITYPEWVSELTHVLLQGRAIEPLQVIRDGSRWLVVDGNHRLRALRRVFTEEKLINCIELKALISHSKKKIV